MNPPKKIIIPTFPSKPPGVGVINNVPTFSTPTLDPNFFTNNPTPVPLGTATSGSTTSGSIPTPVDQSTVVNQSTTVDEENTSTDIITAMLAIYKFVNRDKTTGQNVQILPADGSINDVGILLTNNPNDELISITPIEYSFVMTVALTVNDWSYWSSTTTKGKGKYNVSQKFTSVNDDTGRADAVTKRQEFNKKVRELTLTQFRSSQSGGSDINGLTVTPIEEFKVIETHTVQRNTNSTSTREDITSEESKYKDQLKPTYSNVYTKRVSENKISIENPLKDFGWNDAFKLLTQPPLPHYIRFGALLEFLLANVLIKIKKTGEPIFKIDHNEWGTYMYSLPNQISFDPRVCIVRNDHIEVGFPDKQTLAFNKLNWFREFDGPNPSKENSALTLNIYLNFDFVTECLKTDDKGNVSVYQFLSNICTGLNKALGGINNLEPVIDETNNTLRIIDTTPIPGRSVADNGPEYILQIYGYDKLGNNFISNFVRKVDLKTAITPEYATMITVGATAGGYVKGTEATAFSKWNTGLTDRFKEEFLPPNGTSANSNEDEADDNYVQTFIIDGYANRYGLTYLGEGMKLSDNIIEKNISIVTEYYKWLIAKKSLGDKPSGGTVGFIPFKLGLTLDGISGIKIYNVLRINTEFLPKAYGKTVDLIVTGVSHRLDNNDWETSIESTVMPKTGNTKLSAITVQEVKQNIAPLRKEIESSEQPEITGEFDEYGKNLGIYDKSDNATSTNSKHLFNQPAKGPLGNLIKSAYANLNVSTRSTKSSSGGNMGCALAVSIMFYRATGKSIMGKGASILEQSTATMWTYLSGQANLPNSDWSRISLSEGKPGDIVITSKGSKAGHTGILVYQGKGKSSYTIISNSSGGFNGDKKGQIEMNYNVNSWSSVTKRNPTKTHCFRYGGTFLTSWQYQESELKVS